MVGKTPKLIGISGCTNGGKTTLSRTLMSQLSNACYLSQDDFYHSRDNRDQHYEYIPELESFNFDVISCIDMHKFHKELNRLMRLNAYDWIVVDGILLYEDDKLVQMLDRRYFLDLDKAECSRRRQSRNYILPDTGNYFELCAWKEFCKYKAKCEQSYKKAICYINGAEKPDTIFSFVFADMQTA